MTKKNKKIKKHIFRLSILIIIIFAIRAFNDFRYNNFSTEDDAFIHPFDLKYYDLNKKALSITHIKGNYLNGFHILPDKLSHQGLVIVFGGSTGYPDYNRAVEIASQGYEVLSLFYYGMENQNKNLSNIPIDFYEEIEKYIGETMPITVIGYSKGAELALILSGKYDNIDNLILFSPSVYITEGDSKGKSKSPWTYKGEKMPFISMSSSNKLIIAKNIILPMLIKSPISYRQTFLNTIENDKDLESKLIDFKNSRANILIFAGEDDQIWPSDLFAKEIKKIAPNRTEVNIYKDTGHMIGLGSVYKFGKFRVKLGGHLESSQKAEKDMNLKLKEHLENWHKKSLKP